VSSDDLLAAVREFLNPELSRSGRDRCLRRHGVGNLRDLQAKDPRAKHKAREACEPSYLHVGITDLPQMAHGEVDQKTLRGTVFPPTGRRYPFVARDRATRWLFIRILRSKTATRARRFLRDLEPARSIRIRTV
jgi:hypothetical protein